MIKAIVIGLLFAKVEIWDAESRSPIAARAHGPQIDWPVSPATGVIDFSGRRAANLAFATISIDYFGDYSRRNHELSPGKASTTEVPKLLPEGGLAICGLNRPIRKRGPKLPNKRGHLAAMLGAIRRLEVVAGFPAIRAMRSIGIDRKIVGGLHHQFEQVAKDGSELIVRRL